MGPWAMTKRGDSAIGFRYYLMTVNLGASGSQQSVKLSIPKVLCDSQKRWWARCRGRQQIATKESKDVSG